MFHLFSTKLHPHNTITTKNTWEMVLWAKSKFEESGFYPLLRKSFDFTMAGVEKCDKGRKNKKGLSCKAYYTTLGVIQRVCMNRFKKSNKNYENP